MPDERTGWSRSRPIRIAFLVQEGENSSLALDGIFADCYNRWGGRFSLIVPCKDGRITPSYWAWLEAYDPDVVYSYVPMSKEDVLKLHEQIFPSEYIQHEIGRKLRLDVSYFKPKYQFSPLSSLSTIFRLARYMPITEGTKLKIIDSWHTEAASAFLTDNFGTYHQSHGGGMYPPDATAAANLMTIVAPERMSDRKYGIPRDLDAIPDELSAFKAFAERKAISMSLASTLLAPKLNLWADRAGWGSSFNLVIGDSFSDRILFWNARLLLPAWLDTDINCLRVSLDQLRNAGFLAVLGEFLKRRNYVNSGSGGQAQLKIRSISLSQVQLDEAQQLISSTKPWCYVSTEVVSSLDALVPSEKELKEARGLGRVDRGLSALPDWTRFTWSMPAARPPSVMPDHLADAPARQAFAQGCWYADFMLEHGSPSPRFGNDNKWILPRRWRMVDAFSLSRTPSPPHIFWPLPRTNREGNISVAISADHPIEKIAIPTSYDAIRYALVADGRDATEWEKQGEIRPPLKAFWMEPSNEARYLTGVLGVSGGLQQAKQLLLHPFLTDVFARLGGTPNIPADKATPTVNLLKKMAYREQPFDLKDEGERQALARLIIRASNALKQPLDFVRYDDLKEEWAAYRKAYWDKHPQDHTLDPDIDWDGREQDSLDDCLIKLRERQMLFQGHQWTCKNCHHKNWVDLSSLSSELPCEVCKRVESMPVNIQWLFRPNRFLIESLRDHSVLSLVWVLSALRETARTSFLFAEPSKFGLAANPDIASAEADLLAVVDGEAILCEAKSSWAGVRSSDITKLVELAKRLRPDTALLAVMEKGTKFAAEIEAASAQLLARGIGFKLLTPDQYMLEDDPQFMFYESS